MPRRPTVWLVEEFGHGGIGRYAVDVSNALGEACTAVVATSGIGPAPGLRGRSVTWFPRPPGGAAGRALGGVLGLLRALTSVRRGDVAWVPLGIRPVFELLLVLVLRARTRRVVATVHNRGPHGGGESGLVRRAAALCSTVVVHTDAMQAWAQQHGMQPARLPFPPPDVVRSADGALSREDLGLRDDAVVVSLLGYLYPYKGVDLLVDAWAAHRARRPDAATHLLLAGRVPEGPDGAVVRDALDRVRGRDGVTLREGWLEEEELSALLDLTDVVALPYRRIDNSGMGVLAASRGVPALASDLPGLRSLLGGGAVYVPVGDVDALSEALDEVAGRLPGLRAHIDAVPTPDLPTAYRGFVDEVLTAG